MEKIKNSIEIVPYSKEKLLEVFVDNSRAPEELINEKNHFEYIDKYLDHLGVKTIILEYNYIDRDFLEDFSAYYVRCFKDYERKCTRLHFFSNLFGQAEFESFLENFNKKIKEDLNTSYLGFIVIKRLPQTMIGRTCLKTYPVWKKSGNERGFPITRDYEANLCGIKLTVKSLAFQEQDTVVAACATSALWSAFQGTGMLFHHKLLSPVEITRAATKHLPVKERSFPNKGLNIEQMVHAVQELDMEVFLVEVKREESEYILKNHIYAYLTYGIPIILGIDLYEANAKDRVKKLGRHAVVVTGYRLESKPKEICNHGMLCVAASNMTMIYVHDDQIGPFAKMEMDGEKIPGRENKMSLSTQWKNKNIPVGGIRAVPIVLLIPLYHKIRIPFEKIYEIIELLDRIVDISIEKKYLPIHRFVWDIFLTEGKKFKEEILSLSKKGRNFKDILEKSMPRFVWRAKALCNKKPVMDLLFDATDIEQGDLFLCGLVYDQALFSKIQTFINIHESIFKALRIHPAGRLLAEFLEDHKGLHGETLEL